MYLHTLRRIISIFFIVLIPLVIGDLIIENKLDDLYNLCYNLLFTSIYYIPHSFIASYFIFISVFLFKKKNTRLNKNITNKIIFSPVKLGVFIAFIGLSALLINFFLREVFLPNFYSNTNAGYIEKKPQNIKKVRNKIYDIIDSFQKIDTKNTIKLANDLEKDSIFLANFFKRVALRFKRSELILIEKAKKVVPNFEEAYSHAKNKEYDKAIEIFNKQKDLPEVKYFIDKILAENEYFTKNIKRHKIERLLSLGDSAYKQKQVDEHGYIEYIKTLSYYFPEDNIKPNLDKYEINKVTPTAIKVIQKLEKVKKYNLLHKNLFFMDSNIKFVTNKESFYMGKTILSIGRLFIHKDNIFLKDIILLSNIDSTVNSPVYLIKYAQWIKSEKKINIYHIKNILSFKKTDKHYIKDRKSGSIVMSSSIKLYDLVRLNKTVKMAPNVSIYDLYYVILNHREVLPLGFKVYFIDKLSYYGSSGIIVLIILSIGLILRTRNGETPKLHTIIIVSLFLLMLTIVCHYLVKSFLMLILSSIL